MFSTIKNRFFGRQNFLRFLHLTRKKLNSATSTFSKLCSRHFLGTMQVSSMCSWIRAIDRTLNHDRTTRTDKTAYPISIYGGNPVSEPTFHSYLPSPFVNIIKTSSDHIQVLKTCTYQNQFEFCFQYTFKLCIVFYTFRRAP